MHKFSYVLWLWSLSGFLTEGVQAAYPQAASKPVEVVLGKEGTLAVIEYGSLSCGGCAYFAKAILPAIEKEGLAQ